MGTRHLIAVAIDGEYKVAQYGQWDGYFEGQGVDVLNFLKNVDYNEFKNQVRNLTWITPEDIETINGWDEEFMKGYAYEDNDFGDRWVRAGLPFEVHDEIKAVHQYHPRSETIKGGTATNMQLYHDNTDKGVTKCLNGLRKL